MSGDMLECYDVGRCSRHLVGRVQGMQLNILQRTGQPTTKNSQSQMGIVLRGETPLQTLGAHGVRVGVG